MQVAVAASGAEYRPGRVDGRAVEHAFGYRPGQVDTQAADLAHRGDSRVKGAAQIACAARGPQRDRFERNLPEVHGPDPDKVTVAVPHSGQHSLGPVHRRARSVGCFAGGARVADDRTIEHDHTVGDRLAAARHEQFSFDPFHVLPHGPPAWPPQDIMAVLPSYRNGARRWQPGRHRGEWTRGRQICVSSECVSPDAWANALYR